MRALLGAIFSLRMLLGKIRSPRNIVVLLRPWSARVREVELSELVTSFGAKRGRNKSDSIESDLTEQREPTHGQKNRAFRGATVGALALLAASAMPGSAVDTATTFVVDAGIIGFSTIATTANIGPETTGTTSVSGSLGAVTVPDNRGGTTGWSVTASSTTFTRTGGGANSTSTAVGCNSGTVTSTGTVTAASDGAKALPLTGDTVNPPTSVVTGTAVSGNNTASFTPTLFVQMPASALAGTYNGTVGTSVA